MSEDGPNLLKGLLVVCTGAAVLWGLIVWLGNDVGRDIYSIGMALTFVCAILTSSKMPDLLGFGMLCLFGWPVVVVMEVYAAIMVMTPPPEPPWDTQQF